MRLERDEQGFGFFLGRFGVGKIYGKYYVHYDGIAIGCIIYSGYSKPRIKSLYVISLLYPFLMGFDLLVLLINRILYWAIGKHLPLNSMEKHITVGSKIIIILCLLKIFVTHIV